MESACGFAQSATGPFYCPRDRRVYLDLGFFAVLSERFGAPGDFARAYVIAHESRPSRAALSGIEARVRAAQRDDPAAVNPLSVRLELQADCFAGVRGHAAAQPGRGERGQVELEAGDVDEGLRAAAAIGDDRLQRMSTGHVAPDRFTHGTSAQRVEWFRRGLTAGRRRAARARNSRLSLKRLRPIQNDRHRGLRRIADSRRNQESFSVRGCGISCSGGPAIAGDLYAEQLRRPARPDNIRSRQCDGHEAAIRREIKELMAVLAPRRLGSAANRDQHARRAVRKWPKIDLGAPGFVRRERQPAAIR